VQHIDFYLPTKNLNKCLNLLMGTLFVDCIAFTSPLVCICYLVSLKDPFIISPPLDNVLTGPLYCSESLLIFSNDTSNLSWLHFCRLIRSTCPCCVPCLGCIGTSVNIVSTHLGSCLLLSHCLSFHLLMVHVSFLPQHNNVIFYLFRC